MEKQIKNSQAIAPETQNFGPEAFTNTNNTVIRWLGNAGEFINSHGTCIMLDPLLKGFDMPILRDAPIQPEDVPFLDAILITHDDNDHLSKATCRELASKCKGFHAPIFVAGLMEKEGWTSFGYKIGDTFEVGVLKIKLTPADHAWKNAFPKYQRIYDFEDYCGFWVDTPDGSIWAIGDSRLLPEQLDMPQPDALFFDFSDSSWHIGFENAIKLANTYPQTDLLLCHWGTVDAPEMTPFNGDPQQLMDRIINPERIRIVAPGEPFILKRKGQ